MPTTSPDALTVHTHTHTHIHKPLHLLQSIITPPTPLPRDPVFFFMSPFRLLAPPYLKGKVPLTPGGSDTQNIPRLTPCLLVAVLSVPCKCENQTTAELSCSIVAVLLQRGINMLTLRSEKHLSPRINLAKKVQKV